jgi:hypothetical protein
MKQKIKKVKVLAKRYKSEVDSSCLYETEVKLVRAEENNGDITYTVLILNTFDDMVNGKTSYPPEGKTFDNLKEAKTYFTEQTVGMYKNANDEFVQTILKLSKNHKPIEEQDLFEHRDALKNLLTEE